MSTSQKKKSRRERIREKRQRDRQRRRLTIVLIVAGAALIVAAILIIPSLRPVGEIVAPQDREHPRAEGTAMGDPDAPVVLEEFSDFQCPACRIWYESTELQIIQEYVDSGEVYFIYRNFPFIGNESFAAANASLCAAEQGRFWDYHDLLFANQIGENVGAYRTQRLQAFAEYLNLDTGAFNACLASNRYQDSINEDLARGRSLGVNSTPSIVINDQLMPSNALPTLQQQIEAILADAGN